MINKNILNQMRKEGFSNEELYDSYKIFFGTLVSEPRLKIINSLMKSKKNVSELMKELGMNQAALSHNLARLRNCGFVVSEREGKFVYYSLNGGTIRPLMKIIENHMSGNCIHILRGMKNE